MAAPSAIRDDLRQLADPEPHDEHRESGRTGAASGRSLQSSGSMAFSPSRAQPGDEGEQHRERAADGESRSPSAAARPALAPCSVPVGGGGLVVTRLTGGGSVQDGWVGGWQIVRRDQPGGAEQLPQRDHGHRADQPVPGPRFRRQRRAAGLGAGVPARCTGRRPPRLASTAASSRPSENVTRPALAVSGMGEPRSEHEREPQIERAGRGEAGRRARGLQRSTVSSPEGLTGRLLACRPRSVVQARYERLAVTHCHHP